MRISYFNIVYQKISVVFLCYFPIGVGLNFSFFDNAFYFDFVERARRAGFTALDLAGIHYDPFSERSALTADTSVNYLAHFRRDGSSA